MIAFFAFVVCMVICGALLIAAIILNWRHYRARRLSARDVIRLTEQEATERRAREPRHREQEEQ